MSALLSFAALLACLAPTDQVSFTLTGPDLALPRDNQRLWVEVIAPAQAAVTLRFLVPLVQSEGTDPVQASLLEETRSPFAAETLTDRTTLEGLRSLVCEGSCLVPYDLRVEGVGDGEGAVAWEAELWVQWSLAAEGDPAPLVDAWAGTGEDR